MKRLALLAAVLFIGACTAKENAPASDTAAAPAMAPAPAPTTDSAVAPVDSAMKMDSTADTAH
ncbi:MAG TPA: hypothetical protein VIQ74_13590 [Gemmatimonadaceae bacterium]